ncbi:MAG: hypothetical protein NT160_01340 [Actinobacteria bacterium]|nr:hypothetical protein [Actinomycetota bacterium]
MKEAERKKAAQSKLAEQRARLAERNRVAKEKEAEKRAKAKARDAEKRAKEAERNAIAKAKDAEKQAKEAEKLRIIRAKEAEKVALEKARLASLKKAEALAAKKAKAQKVEPEFGPYRDDAEFLAEVIDLIASERHMMIMRIEMTVAETDELSSDSAMGDTQFDEESGEGANTAVDLDRDRGLINTYRYELAEFEAAVERVNSKKYGMCGTCFKKISKDRLRAMPSARHHVDCTKPDIYR